MKIQREVTVIVNSAVTLVEATMALSIAFGLDLTPQQTGAIIAFTVAIGGFVNTMLIRSRVTPVSDPRDNQGRSLRPVDFEVEEVEAPRLATS